MKNPHFSWSPADSPAVWSPTSATRRWKSWSPRRTRHGLTRKTSQSFPRANGRSLSTSVHGHMQLIEYM